MCMIFTQTFLTFETNVGKLFFEILLSANFIVKIFNRSINRS